MSEDKRIVRCAIHPTIGIARIGNALPASYYLGPEIPGLAPDPKPPGFKDDKGQIRKQGARFRIYGYAEDGSVVKEITADHAHIQWEVHLANRKAGWYHFTNAMDLRQYALPASRRNPGVPPGERRVLEIDPGPRRIQGRDKSGLRFDSSYIKFPNEYPTWVQLGELRTDPAGRLIVLGGSGNSASPTGAALTGTDNDGWYDDISDGPVRAWVKLKGRQEDLIADPAMVVVTPPNFGPGLQSVVTLYDVIYDMFRQQGWTKPEEPVTFWRDIYPIFRRMVSLQWVSQGAYALFGPGSRGDLTDPERRKILADPGEAARKLRETVFKWFRRPAPLLNMAPGPLTLPPAEPHGLPPHYGDGADFYNSFFYFQSVTSTQYDRLALWAAGDFVPGDPPDPKVKHLDQLDLQDQPGALDQANLDDCLGGPFHPSLELTWPVRVPTLWHPPAEVHGLRFRLRIQESGHPPINDFGPVLTPEICLGPGGPLQEPCGPGTLTRWMALPWQADTASCQAGYVPSTYLPLPALWAARCPIDVLSEEGYFQATSEYVSPLQKFKQFSYRQFWLRDLPSTYSECLSAIITKWSQLGIVAEKKTGLEAGHPDWLPDSVWVETGRDQKFSNADPTWKQILMVEGVNTDMLPEGALQEAALSLAELVERTGELPENLIDPRWFRGIRRDRL